jgi:hypothetical protein
MLDDSIANGKYHCTAGPFMLLQVLKDAACKHPDFVATNLGPGVLEAFNFQSRLWAAKHPGKPMPKGEHSILPLLNLEGVLHK